MNLHIYSSPLKTYYNPKSEAQKRPHELQSVGLESFYHVQKRESPSNPRQPLVFLHLIDCSYSRSSIGMYSARLEAKRAWEGREGMWRRGR